MYEYIGEKTKAFRIQDNWVFFDKGKIVKESEAKFAINHGVDLNDFVLKENKVIKIKKFN